MAYAALVSLAQLLEQILYSDQQSNVIDHEKEQIKTLRENVIFLTTSLEDFPGELCDLEARITTAANQAEDIIEYHISDELCSMYGSDGLRSENGSDELHKLHSENGSDEIRSENGSDEPRSKYGMCFRNALNCFRQVKLSPPSTQPADLQSIVFTLSAPSTQPAGHQSIEYTGLKHHNGQSLYRKLQKSIEEIDSTLKEVMQIKSSGIKDLRFNHSSGSSSSSSRLPPKGKDAMVGFEEHLMEVKARLCGEPSKLHIIPIVGMGGIGKTTLAKYAYDDRTIVNHFDLRAWVTVSQNYDAQRILLGLLYCVDPSNKETYESTSIISLEERVYQYLKMRRYLIILDDMWNTNAWDDVRRILPDDSNGSCVIITTRELDVASYADCSSHPYQMELMDVGQSWRLLRQKVFGRKHCPPELEKIGMLIAKDCKGLPLAIVVIAGVLQGRSDAGHMERYRERCK